MKSVPITVEKIVLLTSEEDSDEDVTSGLNKSSVADDMSRSQNMLKRKSSNRPSRLNSYKDSNMSKRSSTKLAL